MLESRTDASKNTAATLGQRCDAGVAGRGESDRDANFSHFGRLSDSSAPGGPTVSMRPGRIDSRPMGEPWKRFGRAVSSMSAYVLCDRPPIATHLRRILVAHGSECSLANVFPLSQAK